MPPPRRYPIDDARDALLEESPPPRYFGGSNSFSPRSEIGLQASDAMGRDDLFAYRDKLNTEASDNAYSRLNRASQTRRLPFTEAAMIAQDRLAQARDEATLPDVPLAQSVRHSELTNEQTALQDADPEEAKLQKFTKDPAHTLAYQHFLNQSDPDLPPQYQRKQAFNQALRYANEAPMVNAVESAALANKDDPAFRDKYLQDVVDPNTGFHMTRLKPDADRGEVAQILRKDQTQKQQISQEREARQQKRESRLHIHDLNTQYADAHNHRLQRIQSKIDSLTKNGGDADEIKQWEALSSQLLREGPKTVTEDEETGEPVPDNEKKEEAPAKTPVKSTFEEALKLSQQ